MLGVESWLRFFHFLSFMSRPKLGWLMNAHPLRFSERYKDRTRVWRLEEGTGGGGLSLYTVFYPSIIVLWSHLLSRLLEILDLAYV